MEEINRLVKRIAGTDAIELAKLIIEGKENVSEFKIAEKMKMTINTVRVILYKLQHHNLITSTRKKDKQKGWYIYYWTFNHPHAKSLIQKMKDQEIKEIQEELSLKSSNDLFTCKKRCFAVKFQQALENDYKCPECNSVLVQIDTSKEIVALKKQLSLLKEMQTSEVQV